MYKTTMEYSANFENLLRGKGSKESMNNVFGVDTTGYPFPSGFEGDYIEALTKENLFRRYGTVVNAPAGDIQIQAVASSGTAQIVDAGTSFPESSDTFETIVCSSFKLAALTKLYTNFVADKRFDVTAYLKDEFARRFGRAEENIMLNGTGIDEPSGVLKDAQVGCSTSSLTYDDVIKLYFSVKPEYRRNAVWIVNDETAYTLRTLKDQDGNYLWNQEKSTILDRPVIYSQYMPDVEVGAKPIVFGDLSYVWLIERSQLNVRILVEKYLLAGMFGYAATERFDSKLIRSEAVKVLKIVAPAE